MRSTPFTPGMANHSAGRISRRTRLTTQPDRRHDIDWLRNLAVLLLVPFHTARVFDVWEPNYAKSAELSVGLSWFIAFVAVWHMPLLFALAGLVARFDCLTRSRRILLDF